MKHAISQWIIRMVEKEARKERSATDNLVHLSPILLWVGIVCGSIFLIPGVLVPLTNGDWASGLVFLGFSALSFSMVIAYINCRIYYTETEFTVKYFLGYRRTFTYDQIESIRGDIRDVKLMVNGHAVLIDEIAVGKIEFLTLARKQYRITHGGKPIPKMEKDKWDPFNGHVDNPEQYVFAYLLVFLVAPVSLFALSFKLMPTPVENLVLVKAAVTSVAVDSSDLDLTANGEEMEIWGYKRSLAEPEEFISTCRSGEVLTLGYRAVIDEGKVIGYCVEYIQDSCGKIWLTPQDVWKERMFTGAVAIGIFELIWLIYCGASIYVGRNPQKFSLRVIRWFFKDGYVHW